jgi:O-antigen/teichoic acid export membrane protein
MRSGLGALRARTSLGPYAWGGASQLASSGTNFGLTLLAARAIGADAVGEIFVGFSGFTLLLGIQRSLLHEPLVTATAALDPRDRTAPTSAAITASLSIATIATAAVAIVAPLLPHEIGHGLLVFVPWLLPALVQDLWRMILFRDGGGRAAAANDALWFVVMVAVLPCAFVWESPWTVAAVWGSGAVAATVAGFAQVRIRPSSLPTAVRWVRDDAWPLGRWLSAASILNAAAYTGLVFALAVVIGTTDLGGLRAVQAAFAPLTLLGPAVGLPGLPALSRRARRSDAEAARLAAMIGALAFACTALFVAMAAVLNTRLLAFLFGDEFRRFDDLLWPVAVGQLLAAPLTGASLLITAQRRGPAALASRAAANACTLGFGVGLAATHDVVGAAWGISCGTVAGGLIATATALAPLRRARGHHPDADTTCRTVAANNLTSVRNDIVDR